MIRRYVTATILLFSLLLTNGNCQDASDKNFKTECFTEPDENSDVAVCKDSRINIKGTFYKCESALSLQNPVKRIGFVHEDVLVLSGRQKILIDGKTSEIKAVRRIAPAVTQIIDRKGNIYYGGNNVVYAQRQLDNEYVEIVTHGVSESHNDIALDETSDILFILSHYEDENTSTMKHDLYTVPISLLDSKNESISAEKFEGLKGITSIAFNSANKNLYIGIQSSNGGGKLIKIKGQTSDPCAVIESYKQDIEKVLTDFKDKIIGVFDKSALNLESRDIDDSESDKLLALTWENEQLMIQLNATMRQLDEIRRRLFSGSSGGFSGSSYAPWSTGNRDPYGDSGLGGIEERMGTSTAPQNINNGYSLNILISPPQIVQLPSVNGSTGQSLLFSPISINISQGNRASSYTTSEPINIPSLEFSTVNPILNSNQFNQETVTLPRPDTITSTIGSTSMNKESNMKIEPNSDSDYNFE